ncbi:MAG TPA: pyridoxamine 5'-phosphate oxidase family protein [Opitutales bacterium]|nr:pyridoxamine 5'-phosphate oxidase family protein [Opitutales bacterium]
MNHDKLEAMATGQTKIDPELEKAQTGYQALLDGFQSIQLGTVSAEGSPEASYSPAIVDEARHFYVHVSELAAHTANLMETGKASVLVIEDESAADIIFARKRVTFTCEAQRIERHSGEWESVIARFEEKFGKMMGFLKTMEDFHLFRLEPSYARLVLGFGKAYDVTGPDMNEIEHVNGKNGAHRKEGHQTESEEEAKG